MHFREKKNDSNIIPASDQRNTSLDLSELIT